MIKNETIAKSNIEKWAPFFFVLWLLDAMNSILKWYSFGVIFRVIAFVGIVFISYKLKKHEISSSKRFLALAVFFYYLWALIKEDHLLAFLSVTMTFLPFALIIFWPHDILFKCYRLFRFLVIYFAIGSSIITILSLLGHSAGIPYFEMPAQSSFHENEGDYYYMYLGIFPQLHRIGDMIPRACGMMQEPGHFSIVLGFIYLIDRYTHQKINLLLFIAAILAFSSTFFLILLFTEWRKIFVCWKRTLKYLSITLLVLVIGYKMLPADLQELVYYLAYERNLEQVVDSFQKSGSMNEALDERSNSLGENVYNNISIGQKMVGNSSDDDMVLSDYRGFILRKGFIGLTLVIIISLLTLVDVPFELKISLVLTLFMILMHRSWFFYEPFPYCMSFITCSLYKFKNSTPFSIAIKPRC